MHHDKKLIVATWDEEAQVWVATSDDVPGLVTEDPSLDNLVKRISAVIPELLEDNAHLLDDEDGNSFDFCVVSPIKRDGAAAH
jgi:hypothetical protein